MTKLKRNKKCFCGSGNKYKNCHGRNGNAKFFFTDIKFHCDHNIRKSEVFVSGELSTESSRYLFSLFTTQLDDGNWKMKKLIWISTPPPFLDQKEFSRTLINKFYTLMKTINMWAGKQLSGSAEMLVNEIRTPDEALATNTVSFRSNLLNLPVNQWNEMWDRIDRRIHFDSDFRVHGFSQTEVLIAIKSLMNVFPSDWVRARYRENSKNGDKPKFGDPFQPEASRSWFPAYHLARTALGAICVDPGWNYLIEMGLSIKELDGFKESDKLLQQLTNNPGTQHHLCLAAELHSRGLLVGLEPQTGSGNATNDLLVKKNKNCYAIEVKEFTSKKPKNTLLKELNDKSNKLPKVPENPVLFHVVLREKGRLDAKKEKGFIDEVSSGNFNIPQKISAIIIGTRFVDSNGGRVKRETKKIILNSKSINKNQIDMNDLKEIFNNNYSNVCYPCYGIGTFFHFENNSEKELKAES
ncbi:SEC-C metal-binding domain-containing protein [Pseudoalteromonas denitrificans]|uniref:SEC-C motif-containing protein n=1 Tax=Pseudoalteromonas denitrificans DSM 6059 TaxID=1123010 RepID=A0A1I1JGQ6_9GAMM|nr:SEC-C domain-containing protein [Pseudoalteromonas denitrificans]SFC47656.1 SEC-C motif-containing protein [Pseudoalteromonas denitrificans DSM 6059]